ncbi:MAG: hypothetical protein ACRCYS_16380 [Beijerinckiaceae bacterium]
MDFGGFSAFFRLLRWVMAVLMVLALIFVVANAGRRGDPVAFYAWATIAGAAFGGILVAMIGELLAEIATDVRTLRLARAEGAAAHVSRKNDSSDPAMWR